MVRLIEKNDMVEVVAEKRFCIDGTWVERIKRLARAHPKQRYRSCIHDDDDEMVQEMLIAHTNRTFVRPHMHKQHRETLHIVEGRATVIIFDPSGEAVDAWPVGDIESGRTFFYCLEPQVVHMLVIETHDLVFKETTQGPFQPSHQDFPTWCPEGFLVEEVGVFMSEIIRKKNQLLTKRSECESSISRSSSC